MTSFFYYFVIMTMTGTVMYLLSLMVSILSKGRSATFYYQMLICALALLFIPLGIFKTPKIVNVAVDMSRVYEAGENTKLPIYMFIAWSGVSAIFMISLFARYFKTIRKIKSLIVKTDKELIINALNSTKAVLGIKKSIRAYESDFLRSPLIFGIFRPCVVIPNADFSAHELDMIMYHELMHYKHCDILIKLLMNMAVAIHWFNPFVIPLRKSLCNISELCCDESVLKLLNSHDKKDYGNLLISVIEMSNKQQLYYTTAMASSVKGIKKRLFKISSFKRPSACVAVLCFLLALAFSAFSVSAVGFDFVKNHLPETVSRVLETAISEPVVANVIAEDKPVETNKPEINKARETKKPEAVQDNSKLTADLPKSTPAPKSLDDKNEAEVEGTKKPAYSTNAPAKNQAEVTAPKEKIDIVIDEAENFDNEEITGDGKKQIQAVANIDSEDYKDKKIRAYIKKDENGEYELIRVEKQEGE